ncbi:methylated-DNA-[protein]-cysteine S-methyltransferase [Dysgonomonas sp. PFB1-18]|uniref:methylated-DNA--[protein]-cysteine S-methyltransferase n=1 Tax=unclassified Dysgonomonas TaxID=2630389 RepID=UPI002474B77E|nr:MULTISPECIES: methylated-DNA--[protein]-cysteine S-methyltransferase [unclassified Dysgonomonas]MDH6310700.1 methylated-DNA-[protein]-cysteine S-methyltransferase [Dysgonomonas sp. PF1-14]MDH6340551.1 methylated-DNA-[protein]-cysteine S-methyltransferase [Dysgonomonas sp. PF1-16]MDH6382193.1 methylated-DNA-[protein]-cysteine S-methyltransferase [Dysgonomonas sp. PFB1-18]MDH6399536.1 methylated-DNA-[protein]-cysteine S-methyltransferase [Dysgonomonas sp. PF1-23]
MKAFLQSPVGVIEITESDGYISAVRIVSEAISVNNVAPTHLLQKAISQLEEYFAGERQEFDLPLKQEGTPFQQKAWGYLNTIPYGQTVSYKNEAIAISSANACRAVGSANGRNNIAIIVPCHRVVNEGKGLGGYAYGLDVKRYLLQLELRNKDIFLCSTYPDTK